MRRRLFHVLVFAVTSGLVAVGTPAAHATPSCSSDQFGTGGGAGSLTVGSRLCVHFSATVGEVILITVKRTGGSPEVVVGDLYNPDGLYINPMQFFSTTTRDMGYCTAILSGTYTLVLEAGNGTGTATYEYSIDTTTSVALQGVSTPFLDLQPVDVALSTAIFALNAGACTHF